jgi:hypothetical protein
MNCLTIDNPALTTQPSDFTIHSSQSRGLVAQWLTVNGKLVCKWFPAESKETV